MTLLFLKVQSHWPLNLADVRTWPLKRPAAPRWKHHFLCTAALHRCIRKKTAAMQFFLRVTSGTSLQIPPQPVVPDPDRDQPYRAQSIISPAGGMEVPLLTVTPPTKACSSHGPAGKSCWNLDIRVAMLVLTLAGVVILLLLYRLLQMRHKYVWSFSGEALQDTADHRYSH